ncbi:MAG TPA: VOC family protein [Hyphomonadaceae bacterium]|nr:VOC family protein [Hyphomonadaceae bacterium]HPI49951.1 VOC family protein [Hyphomonadaceae bacterium]
MKSIAAASLLSLTLAACGNEAKTPEPPTPPPVETAAPAQKDPLLSAVGIGVSDLAKSTDFYVNVMGMEKIRSYHLDYMDEEVVGYPEAESFIVLMHWTDGSARTYKDLPVKIVTRVKDPVALAAKIKAAGFEVTREPQASAQVGGAIVGFAKDPDGYMLELLPLRTPAPATPPVETPKPN